jgi:hypothetical protein
MSSKRSLYVMDWSIVISRRKGPGWNLLFSLAHSGLPRILPEQADDPRRKISSNDSSVFAMMWDFFPRNTTPRTDVSWATFPRHCPTSRSLMQAGHYRVRDRLEQEPFCQGRGYSSHGQKVGISDK